MVISSAKGLLFSPHPVRKMSESSQPEPVFPNAKRAGQAGNSESRRWLWRVSIRTFDPRVEGSIPSGPTDILTGQSAVPAPSTRSKGSAAGSARHAVVTEEAGLVTRADNDL